MRANTAQGRGKACKATPPPKRNDGGRLLAQRLLRGYREPNG